MDYIIAFAVGGTICALVQILMDKTKLMPGRIMVILVCLGTLLQINTYVTRGASPHVRIVQSLPCVQLFVTA